VDCIEGTRRLPEASSSRRRSTP